MKDLILNTIESTPGIHFRALERRLDCSTSTIDHHARHTDSITDTTINGYRRFFHATVRTDFYLPLAALNHDIHKEVIRVVLRLSSPIQKDLANAIELAPATATYHVKQLTEGQVLAVTNQRRQKYYRVTEVTAEAIDNHGKSLLDEATQRFIGLWEWFQHCCRSIKNHFFF